MVSYIQQVIVEDDNGDVLIVILVNQSVQKQCKSTL